MPDHSSLHLSVSKEPHPLQIYTVPDPFGTDLKEFLIDLTLRLEHL